MTTETTRVPAVSCDHCKRTIEREMMDVEGMRRVEVDVPNHRVTFSYDAPATAPKIKAQMEEIGYPVVQGLGSSRAA